MTNNPYPCDACYNKGPSSWKLEFVDPKTLCDACLDEYGGGPEMARAKLDPVDRRMVTISMRITKESKHYLETRVKEIRANLADGQSRYDFNQSWVVQRMMELGHDLFNSIHLEDPTPFEVRVRKAIKEKDGDIETLKKVLDWFHAWEKEVAG